MTLRPRASLLLVLLSLPLALSLTACNKIQSLSIVPGSGVEYLTAAGQTAQYTAYAQEEMGSGPITTANVTNSVTWSTSNPNVATINSSGLATAVGAGYVEITAVASDGAIATSDLTVEIAQTTPQTAPWISILPSSAGETFIGETTQFTATGNLTGIGNAQDLTTQVQWLSSNAQVATINTSGLATATGAGTTTIIAQSGGLNAGAIVNVTIAATGAGTPTLTVTPSVATDTFAGETTQFIASGNLTGVGSPQNLTNQVTWVSSNAQVATISAAGLATSVGAGTTTITAESGGLNATATLSVTVPASGTGSGTPTLTVIPSSVAETFAGETTQFTATGNLTGIGPLQNLTNQVTWVSSNVQVATINSAGFATAMGSGTTTIIAESGGLDASAILSVSIATSGAPSISVIPNTVTETFAGETTQLTATGNLTGVGGPQNLTNTVNWLSSNVQVATVSASGLVTTLAAGTTTIIAESGGLNASSTVTVTLPATGSGSGTPTLTVTPSSAAETFAGETTQFLATGNLTGVGSSQNLTNQVTWFSSNVQVATINSTGLATAVGAGTTTIVALSPSGGLNASASMSVTISGLGSGNSIASISVIPGTQTVTSPNQTSQYIAIGTTASGATVDLTDQVAWNTSSAQIAIINATTGLATALGQGTATITALYANSTGGTVVAGTATFTVAGGTAEQYTAVTILPGAQVLSSGQTSQFIALATSGSTGLQINVTNSPQITWSSSIPTIATVNGSGLAKGAAAGTSTILAELANPDGSVVSATATVTVIVAAAPEPLLSLSILPNSITVGNLQDTGQFLAIGTYSTVPYVRDLTNSPSLVWISDEPSVFPVSTNSGGGSGASAGLVTAYGAGNAVIIAEATSSDGTIQTATATFTCTMPTNPVQPGQCYPGSQAFALLSTLTFYNEGLNNSSNWLVTAPSATGTPDVIHCGPGWAANGGTGGSVCTATYPMGTTVILTAPAQTGVAFGGWSYNCTPSDVNGNPLPGPIFWTAAGPNYCTVTFSAADQNSDITVGGIFN
jgi:uncharacterized protein YjdB